MSYLADLCRSLTGTSRGAAAAGSGSSGGTSFGEVGEDGTWRLRLNEFAHVLKLASRVPAGVEGALQRRLDELPYNARQVERLPCLSVCADHSVEWSRCSAKETTQRSLVCLFVFVRHGAADGRRGCQS